MFNLDEQTARDARLFINQPVIALAVIKTSDAWVFQEPDPKSPRLTQMLYGENVTIHGQKDVFYWVQSQSDLYCGWIHGAALRQVPQFETKTHCTRFTAPITKEADLKSSLIGFLPPAATFNISETQGDYVKLAEWGWIHRAHAFELSEPLDLLTVAREQLGRSYLWGGRGTSGVDCSGLVQMIYRFSGRLIPRDSDLQHKYMAQNHQSVNAKEMSAGDLIFIPNHVMLYSGNKNVIHASGHHMRVVEEPLMNALAHSDIAKERLIIKAYHW